MAVLAISPISGKSGGGQGVQQRIAVRRWLVQSNNRYDSEEEILTQGIIAGFFPTPFVDVHPTWPGLLCHSLTADQDELAPQKWIVAAQFASEPIPLYMQLNQFLAPLDRPAIIRQHISKRLEAQWRDIFGAAYVNSAGDPIDPPIELPRGFPQYIITKNVAEVPAPFLLKGDAINSQPFFVEDLYVDRYQARIVDWNRSEKMLEIDLYGNEWEYYVLNWVMELDLFSAVPLPGFDAMGNPTRTLFPSGYLVVYLDQGFRVLVGNPPNRKPVLVIDPRTRTPISRPLLLDGQGNALANPSGDTAFYGVRHGYQEIDFNLYPLF